MKSKTNYGLAISAENLGEDAPILFHGDLTDSMVRAAAMGFDQVEIHIRNTLALNTDLLIETINRHQITISAIGTGLEYSKNTLSLTSTDESIRHQMIQRFMEHIDLAVQFNAVVFVGLCRGKAPSFADRCEYLDQLEKSLIPVAEYALRKNVLLGLEPIVFYLTNLLNTTEETLEFIQRPGLESIQLLLDTHHMFIEDHHMFDSFRMCKDKIAHIHISDSNRKYPGCGNIDYEKVGKVLREIQYDRALSLEILPFPDGTKAAENGLRHMRKYL